MPNHTLLPRGATVYISGPITGMPDNNRLAFGAVAQRLRDRGMQAINPLDNGLPEGSPWQHHMRADITAMLTHCDAVVLLPGFQHSKGAMAELFTAHLLGIPAHLAHEVLYHAGAIA